jgi:acetyl-CoA C-acetyltransferase
MARKVAIVACSQLIYEKKRNSSREMMVYEVINELLKNAGISKADIDSFISAQNDYLEGRTISNMRTVGPSGAYLKDESKVEMDGAFAALYAYLRILSGTHDVVAVYGESMASCYPPYLPMTWTLDPSFDRQNGFVNEISAAALQACSYMYKYGITEKQLAKVSVKNLENATKNPYALRKINNIDIETVLKSRLLYSPIRALNAYPLTDGACAILMASEDKAMEMTDKPVWIEGVGTCHDSYYMENRILADCDCLQLAAKSAYKMARIKDPLKEIDVIELHENFSHEELIFYESLGLCSKGKGGEFIDTGATLINGILPVNPSGGALSANPVCATGLIRIAEVVMQIKHEAGEHQITNKKEVNIGLAHGQNGICAQQNIVFILKGARKCEM